MSKAPNARIAQDRGTETVPRPGPARSDPRNLAGRAARGNDRPSIPLPITHPLPIRPTPWRIAMEYEYEEEGHARDLHRDLSEALAPTHPDARVTVEGFGVHWHCTASRGERSCSVSCFDQGGPQYLVDFRAGGRNEAWGRTRAKADTIGAVAAWIDGQGIEDLWARFAFVDRNQRALEAIRAESIRRRPEFGRIASSRIEKDLCDLRYLWYNARDRSCRIGFYADNEEPDAVFHWDECEQLRVRTGDTARLAAMLERWLCDRAMPSAMAREFPEAEVRPVARYYEQGRPVEGEFLVSWDRIEQFYAGFPDHPRYPPARPIIDLIGTMRRAGYDRLLRAGTSLFDLVLSRSRRHGLRPDQPNVVFNFHKDGMDLYRHIDGEERFALPRIELSPQVEAVLERLTARAID